VLACYTFNVCLLRNHAPLALQMFSLPAQYGCLTQPCAAPLFQSQRFRPQSSNKTNAHHQAFSSPKSCLGQTEPTSVTLSGGFRLISPPYHHHRRRRRHHHHQYILPCILFLLLLLLLLLLRCYKLPCFLLCVLFVSLIRAHSVIGPCAVELARK
jgi:hypothetical protein